MKRGLHLRLVLLTILETLADGQLERIHCHEESKGERGWHDWGYCWYMYGLYTRRDTCICYKTSYLCVI
jgi:hypothetical protein